MRREGSTRDPSDLDVVGDFLVTDHHESGRGIPAVLKLDDNIVDFGDANALLSAQLDLVLGVGLSRANEHPSDDEFITIYPILDREEITSRQLHATTLSSIAENDL